MKEGILSEPTPHPLTPTFPCRPNGQWGLGGFALGGLCPTARCSTVSASRTCEVTIPTRETTAGCIPADFSIYCAGSKRFNPDDRSVLVATFSGPKDPLEKKARVYPSTPFLFARVCTRATAWPDW